MERRDHNVHCFCRRRAAGMKLSVFGLGYVVTMRADTTLSITPNLLAREFAFDAPNRVWATDVSTAVPTNVGRISLWRSICACGA
jgi:hypothetical protein